MSFPNKSYRDASARLLAQTDEPLQRLRERDPEQRFRDAVEQSTREAIPTPDLLEDDPAEPAPAKKANSVPATSPAEDEPSRFLPQEERISALPEPQQAAPLQPQPDQLIPEPATDPSKLRRINSIQPFFDYQPPPAVPGMIRGEICWDLCPRPDGMPCKPEANGLVPECPSEFRLGDVPYAPRLMGDCLYQWRASDLYHNPLYFEDPTLERYGHTHHELVQPFVSMGRAAVQLVGLPYQMTIDPVCKKMYNLGYYRPGECAPKLYYKVPWNTHAAAVEAGVWTGLIYIFP